MANLYSGDMPHWFATCVSQTSVAAVEAWIGEMNGRCYRIRSSSIDDESSLFESLLNAVGLTESGTGLSQVPPNLGWAAGGDYFYQELVARSEKHVAILWFEAGQMLGDRLQLFLNAVEWLQVFGEKLACVDENKSWFIRLRLILLGDGPGFPPAIHTVYVPPGKAGFK